jgi:glycerophosphoryl diester phosphodiesterase
MNFRTRNLLCVAALAITSCESSPEPEIPAFTDGGLLRNGTPLAREQLFMFEGMFKATKGDDLFGPQIAVRTSPGTVSLLTDKNAGFSVLQSACLPDHRVVLEGYWQYPTRVETGLVRLFVDPPAVADKLCDGEVLKPDTDLKLVGSYGDGSEFPAKPVTYQWDRELKPWRGTFFTVAHHGACEITDHCGASPNSIETVRLAERIGSNAAELDVRITRDGVPIFFHDPSMSGSLVKGTFCKGAVNELSLAEIRGSCQLEYGEQIPTVQEMLDMMVDETELEGVYLDIKVPEAVEPVTRLVRKLDDRLKERNENDDPSDDRRFGALVAIPTEEVQDAWHETKAVFADEGLELPKCLLEWDADLALEEGCVAWGPTWTEGPKVADVRKVQDAGAITIFWTINQSEFIDRFLKDARPNGIITSRAALLFYRYQTIGTPPMPVVAPQ